MDAVDKVLQELDVASIPKLVVWNKVGLYIFFVVIFENIISLCIAINCLLILYTGYFGK